MTQKGKHRYKKVLLPLGGSVIVALFVFFIMFSSVQRNTRTLAHLPVLKDAKGTVEMKVSVTITKDNAYYVNEKKTDRTSLQQELKTRLDGTEGEIVLHIDGSVPTSETAFVAGLASQMGVKYSLAVNPE